MKKFHLSVSFVVLMWVILSLSLKAHWFKAADSGLVSIAQGDNPPQAGPEPRDMESPTHSPELRAAATRFGMLWLRRGNLF